jgi:hypothetical protein
MLEIPNLVIHQQQHGLGKATFGNLVHRPAATVLGPALEEVGARKTMFSAWRPEQPRMWRRGRWNDI